MKKCFLALAVFALAALPAVAMAGDAATMSDQELDNVAAGQINPAGRDVPGKGLGLVNAVANANSVHGQSGILHGKAGQNGLALGLKH